jgi:hypothetical protein
MAMSPPELAAASAASLSAENTLQHMHRTSIQLQAKFIGIMVGLRESSAAAKAHAALLPARYVR